MYCIRCGSPIPEGRDACPSCATPVRRAGWWARLLSAFIRRTDIPSTVTVKKLEIVTEQDGERKVFHSLDEAPPEIRAKVQEVLAHPETGNTIVVQDKSGQERTYRSLEDMPPEMRVVIERMRRKER